MAVAFTPEYRLCYGRASNTLKNKPANFDSDGHSGTWLHTLLAEA